jgi:GDSL-like Lipase/Acylhydrolase family
MRLRPLGIIMAIAGLLATTTSVSASSEHFNPPKHYYLALGDSLAYGFQHAKFVAEALSGHIDPATFPGYAGDFETSLQNVRPGIQEINYGCPGETTTSYFSGCVFSAVQGFPLHNPYSGSQESAALNFLAAHPGQVSPITLDNGANDVTPCLFTADPNACFATAIAGVGAHLDLALAHLRAAAPNAEIIVMQYYDPFALAVPSSLAVTESLNAVIAAAAAKHGARLADTFTPINISPPAGQNLCTLTLACQTPFDEHASDLGYALIAQQFWGASGYSRLSD